jgi:hypothetical protein
LEENASVFFTLLNESYRINANERLEDITVASVPHMERDTADRVLRNYREVARDVIELTEEDDNFDDLSKLKEAFGQK